MTQLANKISDYLHARTYALRQDVWVADAQQEQQRAYEVLCELQDALRKLALEMYAASPDNLKPFSGVEIVVTGHHTEPAADPACETCGRPFLIGRPIVEVRFVAPLTMWQEKNETG